MTTILAIRTKTSVFLSADTQTSEGHLRLPFETPKIEQVGTNILIASAGGVGITQQILSRGLKNIYIGKILNESYDFFISPKELSKEIASFNFEMPLEHKAFNPFEFIVVGYDKGETSIRAIGDDASLIDIPTYYSCGSGKELALSMLNEGYNPEMSDEEAIALIYSIFTAVNQSDIYTNNLISVLGFDSEGKLFTGVLPEAETEAKAEEKPQPEKDA